MKSYSKTQLILAGALIAAVASAITYYFVNKANKAQVAATPAQPVSAPPKTVAPASSFIGIIKQK